MRVKSIVLLIIMALSINVKAQEIADWWNDVTVCEVNRVSPRTNVIPYEDEKGIYNLDYRQSPYYQCLNGEWKFNWVEKPADKPQGFYATSYDVSSWKTIPVPGNWELNGYGIPVYINQRNEFPSNQPYAPTEYNPVGCYVHNFNVPEEWNGRNIYINFGAVKSAFYLWINGQFVGYSEDAKTPAEFDITPYVTNGNNTLAVEAYRFSDGSYLECQDYWRLSGITRDVILYSKPKTNVFDFFVKAGLDYNYSKGIFEIFIDLNYDTKKIPSKLNLEVEIRSDKNAKFPVNKLYLEELKKSDLIAQQTEEGHSTIRIKKVIDRVEPWSAEKPNLYDMTIRLKDKKGNVEILIDSGYEYDGQFVNKVITQYCTDGRLDVLMATHSDGDHIDGLAKALSTVENISLMVDYGGLGGGNVLAARNKYTAKGMQYHSAYDCVNKLNGATDVYYLTAVGNDEYGRE